MNDQVDITLKQWRSTPFEYGVDDCMLSVAKYIAACGGKDVTHLFEHRYATQEEALTIMRAYGGAAGLAQLTDLKPSDGPPRRGDIVAVATPGDVLAGICVGDAIAVRLIRGVGEIRLNLVKLMGVWLCPV